jgi:hypothetical protein
MRVEAAAVASRQVLVQPVFFLKHELRLRQHVARSIGLRLGQRLNRISL